MRQDEYVTERFFEALADRTRLRLLNLLAEGEICVCYFTAILRAPQPTISRHLAYLRRSGIVEARRDGKWMHYRLSDEPESVTRVLRTVLEEVRRDPQMQRDAAALQRACCGTRVPRELADAPRPAIGT